MYNPEALYYTKEDFSLKSDDPEGLFAEQVFLEANEEDLFGEEEFFDEEESFDEEEFSGEEEAFAEEESFDEDLFEDEENFPEEGLSNDEEPFDDTGSIFSYLDDYNPLVQLAGEINRDIGRMNEFEAMHYMEDRMTEFLPALVAALPAIIQLAPQAISAISSLWKKDPPKPAQNPARPAQSAQPTQPTTTVTANTPLPVGQDTQQPLNDAGSLQLLRVLAELVQSPKFIEFLNNLQSGNKQTVTTNTGQQISAPNVMGVISSLAGTLAGTAVKKSSESLFPEYAVSSEGTFLIDPHNVLQEAELILDLIK